ncbi:MAG: MBL fold metallo-hydrolase [Clostridiales bacterium]|nr:MBL fold metallo-hydrolase [Clostridiales bacterium]
MKKLLILMVCLALLPLAALGEETVIVDKIKGENTDFAFAEDAKLLEIYFPKINGNDAALVRFGEYSMLIDCAGSQWRETETMLKKLGVTELTYAVNSHPDADHIGGFNHVLKNYPAKEFLLGFPEDYPEGDSVRFKVYSDLHALEIPFRRVADGESLEFGDVKVTVLQRTDESLKRVNNKSVMLMIEYGQRRIFFTGDIQMDTQKLLITEGENLDIQADILKYPHHGYANMQPGFLDMVNPELVIVTSGRSTAEGVEILKEEKIPYYFCENGIIRLATDGNVWTVERVK